MFHTSITSRPAAHISGLLDLLAGATSRPRYAFMLLNLIADQARPDGSAGPWVKDGNTHVPIRDWLSDALAPMGQRDPKRIALAKRVRDELSAAGALPSAPAAAQKVIEDEVLLRVRTAGKTNLSRVASELVRAGLLLRHYQGYRVDHQNRGAQRQAVYTLAGAARVLLGRSTSKEQVPAPARRPLPQQTSLPF